MRRPVGRKLGAGAHQHASAGVRRQLELFAPIELPAIQSRFHGREKLTEQLAVVDRCVEAGADRGLQVYAQDRTCRLIGRAHGQIRRERDDGPSRAAPG